jgi:hypothetical protein
LSNKHKRVPFQAILGDVQKKAVISAADPSYNHIQACWRIKRLQLIDPYGWHELNQEQIEYVRRKLSEFESRDWNHIFVVEKQRNHPIPVADLDCPIAREWMRQNLPVEDTLWTLRFSGPERVWGIFRGGAFHLLFYDPQHRIKRSEKK